MNDKNEKNSEQNISEEISDETEIVEEGEELSRKIDTCKKELGSCRKEKAEYLDGWQRAKADFINYKKDEAKRFEAMAQFAAGDMLYDLFPVLDNFHVALSHELPKNIEIGILMIKTQIEDVLKKRGIIGIVVNKGDAFDVSMHESIGEVPSDQKEGTIVEEIQKGYLMHGKVIRPSRVRIAKAK